MTIFRELRFDRDDAAMLMNQCLALLVIIVVFVTGINHVSNTLVCRSVGVLLHYFLLCTLLWIGCSGICLHRLIRTSIEPEEYNPVLRYYMMSWGRFNNRVLLLKVAVGASDHDHKTGISTELFGQD